MFAPISSSYEGITFTRVHRMHDLRVHYVRTFVCTLATHTPQVFPDPPTNVESIGLEVRGQHFLKNNRIAFYDVLYSSFCSQFDYLIIVVKKIKKKNNALLYEKLFFCIRDINLKKNAFPRNSLNER